MTREELTNEIMALCERSRLPLREKTTALRTVLTRVQMNVSSQPTPPRQIEMTTQREAGRK
jgi:hypothetical protein